MKIPAVCPRLRLLLLTGLPLLLSLPPAPLCAELLVVRGPSDTFDRDGGRQDYGVYRYSDAGTPLPGFAPLNEGFYGLCTGPTGIVYTLANTLGSGDLYALDQAGVLTRTVFRGGPFTPGMITIGPDGALYGIGYANGNSSSTARGIYRFDPVTGDQTGPLATDGAGGATGLEKFAFGADGKIYATSDLGIVRFDPATGAFVDVFVPLGRGGLAKPSALVFGPDGNLDVADLGAHAIKRYQGGTGAFLDDFVAAGSGGLNTPADLTYGPDGKLYVASYGSHQVLRYQAATGAFDGVFVNTGTGPRLIAFSHPPASGETVWFDDALPPGAQPGANGGDAWNWVATASGTSGQYSDAPISGTLAHRSLHGTAAEHEHYFNFAQPFPVNAGDVLFVYVFVSSNDQPNVITLSWCDGANWEHRAFWGGYVAPGRGASDGDRYMGPLYNDVVGRWVRWEIPAKSVGLEGKSVSGMSFTLIGGTATWDRVGKVTATLPVVAPPPAATDPNPPADPPPATAWFDDAFPAGAGTGATGGAWSWTSATPAPHTGTKALYSTTAAGLHEQYFNWAWDALALAAGDSFYVDVYLDPAHPPRELVVSFNADNWEHRAYWGENLLAYAADGSPAQYHAGDLPAPGQWVRLKVSAAALGLAGQPVTGLSLTLYDGAAVFDQAGKIR